MLNHTKYATGAAALLLLTGQLMAGGFWLTVGNPDANPEARRNNAVLVIQAAGCHDPAGAHVTATAIGTVDGRRQTIALKVIPLSEPGTFAVARQWPNAGRWVIRLVAKNGEQFTNTLVAAGPDGLDRLHPKLAMSPFTDADIDAML